jgi:SAM-dependent methyltransferase
MKAAEYARMYAVEERQWWYAGMRAIAAALLDTHLPPTDAPRARILDAGCGTGTNLVHLASRGHTFGVDLSAEALRFCHLRGVSAARASVLSLPFGADCFDLVTSFDVLYHRWVPDDRAAVGELRRVLRPGGLLLVRVPALRLLWGAHDEEVLSRHRYTRPEVRALLVDCGLEVLRASYCNTLLFPLLLARRTLDRLLGRHGSDVGFLPAPLERLFGALLRVEAALLPRLTLPIGASVVALARRPR